MSNLLRTAICGVDFGIDSYNSREYLDVTKLHKSIDNVDALPGIYAFTDNDSTPAFYRKGKIKPITLMCKHERFTNAFKCLGEMPLTNDVIEIIEQYTCHLYGHTKQSDIHKVIKRPTLKVKQNRNQTRSL